MTSFLPAGTRRRGRDLVTLALAASLLFHAGLGLAIVLTGALKLEAPPRPPKAIDVVSVETLLPPPATEPAPPPKAAPLAAPALLPAASPAAAPTQAPAPAPGPALNEDLGPATATGGGMTVPTGSAGPAAPAPAAAPAASAEPDYLPQFKITDAPLIPARAVLSRILYPPLAAKQGIEATVFLEIFIDAAGSIRKITVLKDPGYGFAAAAVSALSGISCVPAMVDGRPVAVRYRYPVRFMLK